MKKKQNSLSITTSDDVLLFTRYKTQDAFTGSTLTGIIYYSSWTQAEFEPGCAADSSDQLLTLTTRVPRRLIRKEILNIIRCAYFHAVARHGCHDSARSALRLFQILTVTLAVIPVAQNKTKHRNVRRLVEKPLTVIYWLFAMTKSGILVVIRGKRKW